MKISVTDSGTAIELRRDEAIIAIAEYNPIGCSENKLMARKLAALVRTTFIAARFLNLQPLAATDHNGPAYPK